MDDLIKAAASKYGLNWLLVKALCIKESNMNTWSFRYEPKFRLNYEEKIKDQCIKFARKNEISVETEIVLECSSFGLMQVMGCVARELGYKDSLTKLLMPVNGLEIGCKKLYELVNKHKSLQVALAAYNAGSGNPKAGQSYSFAVLDILDELEKQFAGKIV